MKKLIYIFVAIVTLTGCTQGIAKQATKIKLSNYEKFGDKSLVTNKLPETKEKALLVYKALETNNEEGKKEHLRFESKIMGVCQKRGCWVTLDLGEDKKAFVKFKDYAFFAPKDAKGQTAIVDGDAEVIVRSVRQLRHDAKDAGKSEAEIEAITESRITYYFLASNLLIEKE